MFYRSMFYEFQDSLKMGAVAVGIGGILLGLVFIGIGLIMNRIDDARDEILDALQKH